MTCKPNTASVLTIPELATKYIVTRTSEVAGDKSLEGRKETLWTQTKVHILQLIVHKTNAFRTSG